MYVLKRNQFMTKDPLIYKIIDINVCDFLASLLQIQKQYPIMEDIITIDLTKTPNNNLLKHIENETTKLRKEIQSRRTRSINSINYRLKFASLQIAYIEGNILYNTQQQALKGDWQRRNQIEVSGTAELDISTKDIYPFRRGFVKTGAQNQPKIEQACRIIVNNQQRIVIGINYPSEEIPSTNDLIHYAGIMVAEAVRFSIARDYQKKWIQLGYTTELLFKAWFYSYKTRNNIINDWTGQWSKKQVQVYSANKQPFEQKVEIQKLLKKIN